MKKKIIAERLNQIAERNNGRLTADDVVADAKNKTSPLHSLFEWNVKKAAEKYWLETARRIIASVEIIIKHEHIEVKSPLYVRDPGVIDNKQGYVNIKSLKSDTALARESLIIEFQRVTDLLMRVRGIAVALQMENILDDIINNIMSVQEKLKKAA